MAFDPTKPANNSALSSAEMRSQLNALKSLIDDLQTQINVLKTAPMNIVLSYDPSPDEATWTYDGDAPPQWELSYSQDSGATWPTISRIPGSSNRSAPDLEPALMRIRAVDATNSPISEFSNSVNVG